MDSPKPRLTRREAARFLTAHGYPLSFKTLTVLCQPSNFRGPPAAAMWGRRVLYDPAKLLEWAEARLRPAPHHPTAA